MDRIKQRIVHRYAQAYVKVFNNDLTDEIIDNIQLVIQFLYAQKRILFFFRLPTIDQELKKRGITVLCERFNLPPSMQTLGFFLVDQKRAFLLRDVCTMIVEQYDTLRHREQFIITSFPAISEGDIAILTRELARQTGSDIMSTYTVDQGLIAGIRIRSNLHLWEFSMAQQLRLLQLSLIH